MAKQFIVSFVTTRKLDYQVTADDPEQAVAFARERFNIRGDDGDWTSDDVVTKIFAIDDQQKVVIDWDKFPPLKT